MKKQKTQTLHREGSCKHGLCGTQLLTVSKQFPLPLHSNTLRNEPKSPGCNINPAIPITHTDVPPLFSFMHILIKRSESSIKMLLNSLFPCSLYAIYYAFSENWEFCVTVTGVLLPLALLADQVYARELFWAKQ